MEANQQRSYLCIDGKCFYASVECAERGLNPFETNLVVADPGCGKNALCLAISPKLKSLGVHNRCRLSDIPGNIKYEIALPRMQLYVDYCADIYSIYLDYIAPEDIHVYSIDEAFIDITGYLPTYHTDAKSFARMLMNEIANKLHIPTTAGIGTNLYLAKIALDITAKHAKDHMGYLDEELYRATLWDHMPLTDFWGIGRGKVNRLSHYGIFTMRDSSVYPVMPTPAVRTPEPTPIATEESDPDASDDPVQGPSGPTRTGSPHTATATPKPSVESGMAFTLTILGKNISVAGNVEASTLDKAPGWLPTSAKPGKEGVCVVYGHRNRNHLLVLKDIDYGDTILVTMPNGKTYTYIVEQTEILDSDDELRIPIIEGKHLILVTCYPFYYSGHAPKQFVATCTIQKNNMSG